MGYRAAGTGMRIRAGRGDPGIGSFLRKAGGVLGVLPIPGAGVLGKAVGLAARVGTGVAAGRALARRVPALGLPTGSVGGLGPGPIPQLALGGPMPRKRRRINPLNIRALNRALSRVKSARKIAARIERAIPRKTARRAATRKKC
jgi:hypothetical protein